MKKKILIILIFIGTAQTTFGQNKKDNTIIVHGFVSYSQLKDVLFDQGYIPTNSDTSFIATNYKPLGFLGEVSFLLKRTDSTLILKGLINAKFAGFEYKGEPLENVGEKGTVYKVGFSTMNTIAKTFKLPVTYLRIKQ